MQKKQLYTTPEVETLVVQIEGAILEASPKGWNQGDSGWWKDDDDYNN